MDKTRTLKEQIKYMKNMPEVKLKKEPLPHNPSATLQDEHFIAMVVWECLKNKDVEGILEAVEAHLNSVNKSKVTAKNDLARDTLYKAFKGKNPTLRTLAKIVNCCL